MASRKTFLKKLGLLGAGFSGLAGFAGSSDAAGNPGKGIAAIPGRLDGTATGEPVSPGRAALKPKALRTGDTIGMVSPASTLPDPTQYDAILDTVRSLGFHVREGEHARDRWGNFGARDRERAEDLHAMFRDPSVNAVMAFRGGWGSNRMLPLIDFSVIESNPKALIGFSDITSLLLSVYSRTGLVTFHGPVGKSDWTPFTLRSFRRALQEGAAYTLGSEGEGGGPVQPRTIREGRTEGMLLGGNLSVLTSMVGTGYLPSFEGALLFLEEVGEDYYRIDRMLTQLAQSGVMDGIRGFLFGRCADCSLGTAGAHTLQQILRDHILPLDVPAVEMMPFGHVSDTLTLPVGVRARLDAGKGTLALLESPTAG